MKTNCIILILIFSVLLSCKKREYPEDTKKLNQEGIFFDGTIGGEQISFKVGEDDYYCYSSYIQRPDNVYLFEADLKKFNCTNCFNSLNFVLSDYTTRALGASINIDSVYRNGNRQFITGIEKTSSLRFASYSNKEISTVRWDLSNGDSFQDSIVNLSFGKEGAQTVTLTLSTKTKCESSIINKIYVGGESGIFACNAISEKTSNNGGKFGSNIIGGLAPFKYSWDFGDGSKSNAVAPSHTYIYQGSYPVKLIIEDAENHISESNYIFVAGNDISSCALNMGIAYIGSENTFLDRVKIKWTDQANVVYQSNNIDQPQNSYFEILNSQPFVPNERGEAGRQLNIRFNVLVSDGSKQLWIKSENASIVVAYK